MKLLKNISIGLFIISCVASACMRSNIYEKNIAMPFNKWKSGFRPSYEFMISDTTCSYNLYFTMRHTEAYPFSNLWLKVTTRLPGNNKDSVVKVEIPLAQADGKWLGRGMNEVWEHRMPLSRNGGQIKFPHKGIYRVQLEQIMRADPLPEVMSAGIRLEKNPS